MQRPRRDFVDVKRIVVKIGSSSLAYPTGEPNDQQMKILVSQLSKLKERGLEVVLVTSGAIGVGFHQLGYKKRPKTIQEKQAAAAVGQGILMNKYESFFGEYGVLVGQILLTKEDFASRKRFLNARNTLYALLNLGAIPIINENDTVAVDEIKLGDNDTLASRVAGLVDADLLLMLSDIEGLYTDNPRTNPDACLLYMVTEINQELEQMAGGAGSEVGTGGMTTKLQAAKMAMHSGFPMVLAKAEEKDVVLRVLSGEPLGTVFWPSVRLENKKGWIAYSANVQGNLIIDDGAVQALLKKGKSLLPSGIIKIEGDFSLGEIVSIQNSLGLEIGRGIINYSFKEMEKIKGLQSKDIAKVLGYCDYDEVIHRDNLALDV